MNLSQDKFEELLSFIRKVSRENKLSLTRDTLIEEGLGICGDDAAELIQAYAEQFNVDVDSFKFVTYFSDEPTLFNFSHRKLLPFTIGHLEKGIIAGRLDEEIINKEE